MKLNEVCALPVARWPYEQAFAADFILQFERDDDWHKLEEYWSKEFFGQYPDNKVTLKMLSDHSKEFYITFHDCTVYIGLSVRPYGAGPLPKPQKPKE